MPNTGAAIAAGTTGIILVWSGVQNRSALSVTRDIIKGSKPAPGPGAVSAAATGAAAISGTATQAVSGASNAANQAIGRMLAAGYGWGSGAEWTALNAVVMEESGWNASAQNPTSTAYGIGQFLDTTWATVGYSKTSIASLQIAAMLKYIKERYGDPIAAQSFHLANGWY